MNSRFLLSFLPSILSSSHFFFFYLFILNDTVSGNTVLLAVMYKTEIQNRAPDWRCVFGTHTYTQTLKRIQQIRIRISPQVLTTPTHIIVQEPFHSGPVPWFDSRFLQLYPCLSVKLWSPAPHSLTLFLPLSASHCLSLRNKLQIIFLYQETHFWKKD